MGQISGEFLRSYGHKLAKLWSSSFGTVGQMGQEVAGTKCDMLAQFRVYRGGFCGLAWVVLGILCHSWWVAESRE